MLYDIHMLKNYPPVNLNRDDTGSPKTCWFGGVQRGRISSQCQKHSWRGSELFEKFFRERGIRTRALQARIEDELRARECDGDFIEAALEGFISDVGLNVHEKHKSITKQIAFYAPQDIIAIADALISAYEECGSLKEFKKTKETRIKNKLKEANIPITIDIAMFGRMVTSDTFRRVEAAVQVAHAISTHAVNMESDFFAAVDDLMDNTDDNKVAMLDDIDFNSCCYYQYVSIDTDQLRENLKDSPRCDELMEVLLPAFIRIMAFTDPSGKQNTFAGHTLPSLLCVEIKKDKIPVSYANAFADPVNTRRGGVVGGSIDALCKQIDKLDCAFGIESERFWFCPDSDATPEKAEIFADINALCEKLSAPEYRG